MIVNLATDVPVGTGATVTGSLDVRRLGSLTVAYKLSGTVTPADLTPVDPLPYDNSSPPVQLTVGLPPTFAVAPASDGANVVAMRSYDVRGIEKVKMGVKNNNAGTLNISVVVFGEYAGRS